MRRLGSGDTSTCLLNLSTGWGEPQTLAAAGCQSVTQNHATVLARRLAHPPIETVEKERRRSTMSRTACVDGVAPASGGCKAPWNDRASATCDSAYLCCGVRSTLTFLSHKRWPAPTTHRTRRRCDDARDVPGRPARQPSRARSSSLPAPSRVGPTSTARRSSATRMESSRGRARSGWAAPPAPSASRPPPSP